MAIRDYICQNCAVCNLPEAVLSAVLYQLSPERSEQEPEESDSPSGGQARRKGVDKWGKLPYREKSKASDSVRPVAKWVTETLKSG